VHIIVVVQEELTYTTVSGTTAVHLGPSSSATTPQHQAPQRSTTQARVDTHHHFQHRQSTGRRSRTHAQEQQAPLRPTFCSGTSTWQERESERASHQPPRNSTSHGRGTAAARQKIKYEGTAVAIWPQRHLSAPGRNRTCNLYLVRTVTPGLAPQRSDHV
jgi:hypothetical protein